LREELSPRGIGVAVIVSRPTLLPIVSDAHNHVLREGQPWTPMPLDDNELGAGTGSRLRLLQDPGSERITSCVPDLSDHDCESRLSCSSSARSSAAAKL
jgi:hypothetical protein